MKSLRILSALAFVATTLILGACSRSQHVTDSVAGPKGTDPSVVAGCPTLLDRKSTRLNSSHRT